MTSGFQTSVPGEQISGLVCVSTDQTADNIYLSEFFGTTPAGTAAVGNPDVLKMSSLFGYQSTTSYESFAYTSRID